MIKKVIFWRALTLWKPFLTVLQHCHICHTRETCIHSQKGQPLHACHFLQLQQTSMQTVADNHPRGESIWSQSEESSKLLAMSSCLRLMGCLSVVWVRLLSWLLSLWSFCLPLILVVVPNADWKSLYPFGHLELQDPGRRGLHILYFGKNDSLHPTRFSTLVRPTRFVVPEVMTTISIIGSSVSEAWYSGSYFREKLGARCDDNHLDDRLERVWDLIFELFTRRKVWCQNSLFQANIFFSRSVYDCRLRMSLLSGRCSF